MKNYDNGMSFYERVAFIQEKLGPFGLYKEGAIRLAKRDDVIKLLKEEAELPKNKMKRRECPASDITESSKVRYPYRKAMARYLEPWIGTLLPTESLGWPDLEALANYCESRTRGFKP